MSLGVITGIRDEAVRLGERRGAQEGVVERDDAAPFVAEPAVVTLHRVPDGPKLFVGNDVLVFRLDAAVRLEHEHIDRKSTRLNSSHLVISYAVFCLKKKTKGSRLQANDRFRPATH